MPEQFTVCLNTDDAKIIHGALAYWELEADGQWKYQVKAIAAYWGLEIWETSARIQDDAPAYITSIRCSQCGQPPVATSRTSLMELVKGRFSKCQACIRTEQLARIEAFEAQEAARLAKKQADEAEVRKIWERETSISDPIPYWDLSYTEIVRAFALYNCSGVDRNLEITQLAVPPLMPDEDGVLALLKGLRNTGVLQFSKRSPITAFGVGESPGTFTYYPSRMAWRFATAAHEPDTKSLGQILNESIDEGTTAEDLWATISTIWWEVGRSECRRYFDEKLEEYRLHISEGNALDAAINHALLHFSIPQVRNLIWRVAKDTAAYSARADVVRPQAINSIPGTLTRKVDRAVVDGWDLKPFFLKWEEEECALITTLFDRVLGSGKQGYGTLCGKVIAQRIKSAVSA